MKGKKELFAYSVKGYRKFLYFFYWWNFMNDELTDVPAWCAWKIFSDALTKKKCFSNVFENVCKGISYFQYNVTSGEHGQNLPFTVGMYKKSYKNRLIPRGR